MEQIPRHLLVRLIATFIGTFNGVGASGVSALYYDNNDLPTVNGAIVGSR